MINFLLGQHSGYTKYPCLLRLWNSRARDVHWEQKEWPPKIDMTANKADITDEPLVPRDKVIILPLRIKPGLMKQFVKALLVDGCCFNYICNFFPGFRNEKFKAGVFDGPQIQKIMRHPGFVESMTVMESAAWISFPLVVKIFLGNTNTDNYKEFVKDLLFNFQNLGVKMSIKLH